MMLSNRRQFQRRWQFYLSIFFGLISIASLFVNFFYSQFLFEMHKEKDYRFDLLWMGKEVKDATSQKIPPMYISYEDIWELPHTRSRSIDTRTITEPPSEDSWLLLEDDHRGPKGNNATDRTTIPKVLHRVYIQHNGRFPEFLGQEEYIVEDQLETLPTFITAHKSWREHNPGYEIRYYDYQRCRQYLRHYFHPSFLRAFDCLESYAAKVDFFRVTLVYR